jgi:EAL domain-containing protein (putative c-di-GMP-specific phosphodiesterase class I)
LPIWALQVDRAFVKAAATDAAALRTCRAVTALANALEFKAIAAGVDDEPTRQWLLEMGCVQGHGDRYPAVAPLAPPARVPGPARAKR